LFNRREDPPVIRAGRRDSDDICECNVDGFE
jgi:hypothetical protein